VRRLLALGLGAARLLGMRRRAQPAVELLHRADDGAAQLEDQLLIPYRARHIRAGCRARHRAAAPPAAATERRRRDTLPDVSRTIGYEQLVLELRRAVVGAVQQLDAGLGSATHPNSEPAPQTQSQQTPHGRRAPARVEQVQLPAVELHPTRSPARRSEMPCARATSGWPPRRAGRACPGRAVRRCARPPSRFPDRATRLTCSGRTPSRSRLVALQRHGNRPGAQSTTPPRPGAPSPVRRGCSWPGFSDEAGDEMSAGSAVQLGGRAHLAEAPPSRTAIRCHGLASTWIVGHVYDGAPRARCRSTRTYASAPRSAGLEIAAARRAERPAVRAPAPDPRPHAAAPHRKLPGRRSAAVRASAHRPPEPDGRSRAAGRAAPRARRRVFAQVRLGTGLRLEHLATSRRRDRGGDVALADRISRRWAPQPGDAAEPVVFPHPDGPEQHEELAVAYLERQILEAARPAASYRLARRGWSPDATAG